MEDTRFFIDCIPPKSTAQASLRIMKRSNGTQFVGKYAKSKGKKTQDELMRWLADHVPPEPYTKPVQLTVDWNYPWRKQEPKKNRATGSKWCDTRPDVDNLCKLLLDCMTKLGYWTDDSLVASLTFNKRWVDSPGIGIEIKDLCSE